MARKWPMFMALALALAALTAGQTAGETQVERWHLAARWTARIGFPVFLVAYLASPLHKLFPSPWTRALQRDRRYWGLGFAAAHMVHLLALIIAIRLDLQRPALVTLFPGAVVYVFILAMALTSTDAARRGMGPHWKRLHTVGLYSIWLIFTLAYAKRIAGADTRTIGVTMTTLALLALTVRIAARRRSTAPAFT